MANVSMNERSNNVHELSSSTAKRQNPFPVVVLGADTQSVACGEKAPHEESCGKCKNLEVPLESECHVRIFWISWQGMERTQLHWSTLQGEPDIWMKPSLSYAALGACLSE